MRFIGRVVESTLVPVSLAFTQAEEDLFAKAIQYADEEGVIFDNYRRQLTKETMVKPFALEADGSWRKGGKATDRWLNDEIINISMLKLREISGPFCYFWNSFFYSKLAQDGVFCFHNVGRWKYMVQGKPVDLFDLHKIFIPINFKDMHWFLCVAYIQEKVICIYDSSINLVALQWKIKVCKMIHKYLKRKAENAGKSGMNFDSWRFISW